MFLEILKRENPKLIKCALNLWKDGKVEADSYLIDLDTLFANADLLLKKAHNLGIKLYAMTKQIGRNPYIAKKLVEMGYEGIVAVDFREAETLYKQGVKVSHVGHLVQIPDNKIKDFLKMDIEVITVYSLEKAKKIDEAAKSLGIRQKILLKIVDEDSLLYDSQESGFYLDTLPRVIEKILKMGNIELEGLTSFPCVLYKDNIPKGTSNLKTLAEGKRRAEKNGINLNQINAPSATSFETLDILAKHNCTHGEPGHALTGTTPNLDEGNRKEKLAILYLSEVSHNFDGKSYCYGGGYYRRGHLAKSLVYVEKEWKEVEVITPKDESIDYHIGLRGEVEVGSLALMAFRTQIFVTRSKVVLIEGLNSKNPKIIGNYSSLGDRID